MKKLKQVIEQKIRPALAAHNGDIELLEVTSDRFVRVRLTGACAACPGARQTMSETVETAIQESCPEIKGVLLVQQVSDELIDAALKILRKDQAQ